MYFKKDLDNKTNSNQVFMIIFSLFFLFFFMKPYLRISSMSFTFTNSAITVAFQQLTIGLSNQAYELFKYL